MDIDNERLSRLLFYLYRAAEAVSGEEFSRLVIEQIRQDVPFDGVMWTTSSWAGSTPAHHLWALAGVSRELMHVFENDPDGHFALKIANEAREKPQIWSLQDLAPGTLNAEFTARAGMRQVLLVSEWNEALDAFTVLVVGRRDTGQSFDAADQVLLRLLMPHLQAAMVRNLETRTRAALVDRIAGSVGLAVVANGSIVLEEANFAQIMKKAWPQCPGGLLPHAIQQALRSDASLVSCDEATIHVMHEDDHVLLVATRPSPLHALTRKEFAIASDFAQGKSYKEVARSHGLPPETVRSRLRSVYEKLNVTDKAELSRRFTQTELLRNLQNLV